MNQCLGCLYINDSLKSMVELKRLLNCSIIQSMIKDDKSRMLFEVEGEVTALLPAAEFRVKLDNRHEVICHVSGKVRRSKIRIIIGDRVLVEMSVYDRNAKKGRIIKRLKGTSDRTISR